ncbi:hypothetical protein B0H16DRAFT_1714163 [Mycena metata]|uniref:Uncharacterized protein n=1 Tax=Mycena metata TaxID=1033252 RepID=A0AAD7JWJ2_9AGAR|nr:hypothetical protein B0H16DRAFT_1714163 [Mycena metata]
MLSPRDLVYSLFGAPLILDVGPTVNGEMIRVRVQPVNTISVTALVISLLLFIGFMYIYLYPLLRDRRARNAAKRARARSDAEQVGTRMDEEEKSSLLSWLHVRSRDRFSTAHGSPDPIQSPKSTSPILVPPTLRRQPSSFARGSLIPHLSPVAIASPPPAYASQPSTPVPHFHFPSPLGSPHSNTSSSSSRSPSRSRLSSPAMPASAAPGPTPSRRVSATQRVQFDPRTIPSRARSASPALQGRSRSETAPSSPILAVRPVTAPRSVSANTLHPVNPDLHTPSRARVYAAGDSNVRRVARPRESTGLGGIGLAERGRLLTRNPGSWTPVGGNGRVGPPF